ncbi:MAG: hypothetical protein KKF16_08990 [Euryarchaeota archaeon]|nr:hypothetical protein [Euryarchaeota archaeon]MBU4607584.1 hypothetical protein [Euryarchaeota archaeon]MBV1728861.1 hypothetical protein [Methanobacterium sp.]MBV1754872.1 hypothetical protein [Methanobacterium sp.]
MLGFIVIAISSNSNSSSSEKPVIVGAIDECPVCESTGVYYSDLEAGSTYDCSVCGAKWTSNREFKLKFYFTGEDMAAGDITDDNMVTVDWIEK